MTTPLGQISLSDVAVELCRASTAQVSMTEAEVRSLAGLPTGTISTSNLKGCTNIDMSPSAVSSSGTPNSGSGTLGVTAITTVTSYTWSITSISGTGTASIASGQGTSSCAISIFNVDPGTTTIANVQCVVVSHGVSRTVTGTVSYRNTSTV